MTRIFLHIYATRPHHPTPPPYRMPRPYFQYFYQACPTYFPANRHIFQTFCVSLQLKNKKFNKHIEYNKHYGKEKKIFLAEEDIPRYWYNIQADMVNKPMPPLNPATKQPLKPEDLYPIFAEELSRQELNQTDAWIEIPEEVREMYKYYWSTPLVRAYGLEKALGTPAHIYFKNESVSPIGSHKLNSALAQAYYCKKEGVTNVTTETGAGQWGAALSYCRQGVRVGSGCLPSQISYEQKPYRRSIMQTFGAQVTASPSMSTRAGKDILTKNPNYQGSLARPSRKPSNWHARPRIANTRSGQY